MPRAAADPSKLTGLASRLSAFATERHPLAVHVALDVFEAIGGHKLKPRDHAAIDGLRTPFRRELARRLYDALKAPEGTDSTTPGISAVKRMEQARAELTDAFDGFLRREAIAASLTKTERIEILHGMALTRAVDNRLKQFFMGGEVRWGDMAFQGKGFRSLGQEAIYAAGIRLKRGPKFRGADGSWQGDVVAPMIRDLGVALAMRHDAEAVRNVFTAQMGKDGPPMFGKDLHTGDFGWGVLPATAPLAIGALTSSGMALAFWRERSERVAVSFIGEGGSSLGEWHEAINLCAARKLPAIFCLENNQTALSTPVGDNSAVRVFADKAAGYGIPGITIDGTDPEAMAAAFAWAAERARAGAGPDADRTGRDAHVRPRPPRRHALPGQGPAAVVGLPRAARRRLRQQELYDFWAERDPMPRYAAQARVRGRDQPDRARSASRRGRGDWSRPRRRRSSPCRGRRPQTAGVGVFANEAPRTRDRGARAGASPGAAADRGPAGARNRARPSTRRGTRSSKP